MADLVPTSSAFRARLPEFNGVPEHMLAAYLFDAVAELDAPTWGALYGQGVIYLAASRLAATPFGQQAKLADQTGASSYLTHYKMLAARVACGKARVA